MGFMLILAGLFRKKFCTLKYNISILVNTKLKTFLEDLGLLPRKLKREEKKEPKNKHI